MNKESMLLEVLADTIPSDPNMFNSETGVGEFMHLVTLPYDRSLKIVYKEPRDTNNYYAWRVYCNGEEYDIFRETMGVIGETVSDDLSFDTRIAKLDWAINIALEN